MTVFNAYSDESSGADRRSMFYYAGYVAPKSDWEDIFAPLWDERVLKGPPRIPYLHMTDIRKEVWRQEHGITRSEGEFRIDEAVGVLSAIPTLMPVGSQLNASTVLDVFQQKFLTKKGARKKMAPDYFGFLAYAFVVLKYVSENYPGAERVDFFVENNGEITKHIQEFHGTIEGNLRALGSPRMASLLGDLIPAGKDMLPLQAADVGCWFSRRSWEHSLDQRDLKRMRKLKNGLLQIWKDDRVEALYREAIQRENGIQE